MDSGEYSVCPQLDAEVAQLEGWRGGPKGYSYDWALAGPIIERERIVLSAGEKGWGAFIYGDIGNGAEGPTPLIAAMRAYVASRR